MEEERVQCLGCLKDLSSAVSFEIERCLGPYKANTMCAYRHTSLCWVDRNGMFLGKRMR